MAAQASFAAARRIGGWLSRVEMEQTSEGKDE
jgi:hypothetical protein